MSGFHVEFFDNDNKSIAPVLELNSSTEARDLEIVTIKNETPLEEIYLDSTSSKKPVDEHSVKPEWIKKTRRSPFRDDVQKETFPFEISTAAPEKINAEIHPAAVGSFLMGILSALCFVLMFVASFNPVWLVSTLVVGVIVFALLAKKMSSRAFDDMYYARNRYSGKAFAAAGLALGIISLVALVGLVAVVLFGVAFISFS